jgi:tetratricopeptide (TPR) repeat protein
LRLELDKCREIADEVMTMLSGSPEGEALIFEAHWIPGCTEFYAGDFSKALNHFKLGWKLFDLERSRSNSLRTGQNVGVLYQAHIAVTLWELGFPDQALQRAEEVVRFARELDHPFSLAMALYYRRRVYQYCGLQSKVEQSVDEECALCQQHGFAFWLAHALFAKGAIAIQRGEFDAAKAQLQPVVQLVAASGCKCSVSHPYSFIAEAYVRAKRLDEANEWLARGFDLIDNHNERCLESELLRLRGELQAIMGNRADAAASFQSAVEAARRQHARSRELRALMSLCRLEPSPEAKAALAATLSHFSEGRNTADLLEARGLLG